MPATYDSLATTTLGSAVNNITFSSIPSTYTDLKVVLVCTTTTNQTNVCVQFNGDTGANYGQTTLGGNGSSVLNNSQQSLTYNYPTAFVGSSQNTPQLFIIDIFSYAGSTRKMSLMAASMADPSLPTVQNTVASWQGTSAINSIKLFPQTNTFKIGTTATLYGIQRA